MLFLSSLMPYLSSLMPYLSFLMLFLSFLSCRPSVLKGDAIRAYPPGRASNRGWEGYVHIVERDKVMIRFSRAFHETFVPGSRYDIEFTFRRTNLRLQHHALDLTLGSPPPASLLFPTFPPQRAPISHAAVTAETLNPFDRSLNPEQCLAVASILQAEPGTPYIVFGPPGTGKTVTLVEGILQLLHRSPHERLLVLAPSNTAADIFVERLTGRLSPSEMLRLNAYSRSEIDVKAAVKPYCHRSDTGYVMPPLEGIKNKRVVVATCATAARLHNAVGMDKGHFSSIFVDECGHALETEASAPLIMLASSITRVVLAGDPMQLGPIVRSALARDYGLEMSLLERLMTRHLYHRKPGTASGEGDEVVPGPFDERCITKLLRNYRSHQAILELPNRMFYDDELLKCAPEMVTHNMMGANGWEHLPNRSFPVLFHGVVGEDTREESSPSWFNVEEIEEVVNYVSLLINDRPRIKQEEIGIITPYAKQAQKIRLALMLRTWDEVMVGSVEAFQGQERRVIIISTVRSSHEWVMSDRRHNLGFLSNPKRFNVAITRAKALLIVVGCPLSDPPPTLCHAVSQEGRAPSFASRRASLAGIECNAHALGRLKKRRVMRTRKHACAHRMPHADTSAHTHTQLLRTDTRMACIATLSHAPTKRSVLRTDMHWGALLDHAVKNKAYVGAPLQDGDDVEGLSSSLAEMALGGGGEMALAGGGEEEQEVQPFDMHE